MAPKTRFGGSSASRGGPSSSSSKRSRPEPTPSRRGRTRATASSTMSAEGNTLVPSLPWPFRNTGHRKAYEELSSRGFMCTRYLDDVALEHLELRDEVYGLLDGFGWDRLCRLRLPTYRELTLEFLSSLDYDIQPFAPAHAGRISFRLMGVERTHTLESFNSIFGCPLDGVRAVESTGFSTGYAWGTFTGIDLFQGTYDARSSKASKLKSPALRYIHRFLAHSIFARGESTGVVRRDELFFLWAMTNRVQVNTAVWMCAHFQHVRGGTGKIGVGGLVSIIADFYGFMDTPDLCTRVWGNETIDLDTLALMGMCKKERGQYFLLDAEGQIIPKRAAETARAPVAPRASPIFVRDTSTPPQPSATATASASPIPTATASAYRQPSTSEGGAVTMEMMYTRMEQMGSMMMREMQSLRSQMERLDSRVDSLEKKLDAERDSD